MEDFIQRGLSNRAKDTTEAIVNDRWCRTRAQGNKMIDQIIGLIVCIIAFWFVYMSSHLVEEKKQGRYIDLPWEKKKHKTFDKGDVEYRDGDNT